MEWRLGLHQPHEHHRSRHTQRRRRRRVPRHLHGLIERGYWTNHFEATIELRNLGTEEQVYASLRNDLLAAKVELEAHLKTYTGNPNFLVMPNASDPETVFTNVAALYEDHKDQLQAICLKYLMETGFASTVRADKLRSIYDELEAGRVYFIHSQTNSRHRR